MPLTTVVEWLDPKKSLLEASAVSRLDSKRKRCTEWTEQTLTEL